MTQKEYYRHQHRETITEAITWIFIAFMTVAMMLLISYAGPITQIK